MANKTLSEALAEIQTLTTSLADANGKITAHDGLLLTAHTERDAALTRATTAESLAADLTSQLNVANSSLATARQESADLKAKDQNIESRASVIATQRMAAVGQPPVASTKTSGVPTSASADKPGIAGARARLEAAISSSLASKSKA